MLAPPKPPHDELELLIEEARARRRRRHLLAAAGVAIAAALGLSVYALAGGFGDQSATGGSVRSGAPLCRAAQLATSAEAGPGQAPLDDQASVQLVDTSSHSCVLPTGLPTVVFTLRGKTIRAEDRTLGRPYAAFGSRVGHVLAPRRKVMYMLEYSFCPKPAAEPTRGEAAAVILRFRNGLRFAMPEGTPENIPIVPGCGRKLEPLPRVLISPLLRAPA